DKLARLISLGVAAASSAALNEVAISNITIISNAGGVPTLVNYDLKFAFCLSISASLASGQFETDFTSKVQSYPAFSAPSTIALLEFQNLTDTGSQNGSNGSNNPWEGGSPEVVEDPENGSALVIFLILAVAAVLMSAMFLSAWAKLRRTRAKVHQSNEESRVDIEAPCPDVDRVLAHVACSFSPTDVEDDKVFRDSCLDLSEGDIVEVIAGGAGWFYGRVISTTAEGAQVDRMGYFPENRVSWIGKIPRVSAEVESADQHALVSVDLGFSPQEMDEGEGGAAMREHCLHLEVGEVVEVLAGGAGWLYGQVAGHPERAGYFPESRATWLGAGADNSEATRTQ
ncbi:unnamed protein product, partial [Effrenium voratum]